MRIHYSEFFTRVDQVCDRLPVVSTVTNLVDLFQKTVVIPTVDTTKNRYYTYLNQKSFYRCVVLLIPVLGNIIVGLYDFVASRKKTPEPTIKKWTPPKKPEGIHDKEEIKKLVKQDGNDFSKASKTLRDDPDFVMEVLRTRDNVSDGCWIFHYASERLQNDKKFVLQVLEEFPNAFLHASEELRDDLEVASKAIHKANELNKIRFIDLINVSIISNYCSDRLRGDKKFMIDVVKIDGWALEHSFLQDDPDVVGAAVTQNARCFEFASERLQADKKIIWKAMRSCTSKDEFRTVKANISHVLYEDADFWKDIRLYGHEHQFS